MGKTRNNRHWRWTKELIIKEAQKYEYRSDFKKNEPNLYKRIIREKFTEEAFGHMSYKPRKWLKSDCINAAKTCKTKSEFEKRFPGAYKISKKQGWYDELLDNFEVVGNKNSRCIYAYEFEDNTVYVGLTFSLKKRNQQHMSNNDSSVYRHMAETGLKPSLIQKTDYIDYKEAAKLEGKILNEYINNGWTPLNKTKTGGLGSTIEPRKEKIVRPPKFLWTLELLKEEANKYITLKDFRESSPYAYSICCKKGIIDEVCGNLKREAVKVWTLEEAKKEAQKYDNKKEFREKSQGCYGSCQHKGWIPIVCSHMRDLKKERIIYNAELVQKELSKHRYMEELKKSSDKFVRGCYWWLKKEKLLIEYKKYLQNEK